MGYKANQAVQHLGRGLQGLCRFPQTSRRAPSSTANRRKQRDVKQGLKYGYLLHFVNSRIAKARVRLAAPFSAGFGSISAANKNCVVNTYSSWWVLNTDVLRKLPRVSRTFLRILLTVVRGRPQMLGSRSSFHVNSSKASEQRCRASALLLCFGASERERALIVASLPGQDRTSRQTEKLTWLTGLKKSTSLIYPYIPYWFKNSNEANQKWWRTKPEAKQNQRLCAA